MLAPKALASSTCSTVVSSCVASATPWVCAKSVNQARLGMAYFCWRSGAMRTSASNWSLLQPFLPV